FAAALDLVVTSPNYRGGDVPVLGPYFSGSTTSFRLAVHNWYDALKRDPRPKLKVISGSATGIGDEFAQACNAACGGDLVTFHTTLVPDAAAIPRLLEYLYRPGSSKEGAAPARVAFLTESNTGYGRQVSEVLQASPRVVNLPFPLHIAQVRTIYQKERA